MTMAPTNRNNTSGNDSAPVKNNLSFEVEDRFHVDSPDMEAADRKSRIIPILIHLLDILDEQKDKATFFVLGWVAQKFPEIVALIDARGHEVASHGFSHADAAKMPPDKFSEEIQRAKWILEDIVQKPVDGFKAAGPLLRKLDSEILCRIAEAGYRYFFGMHVGPRLIAPNKPAPIDFQDGNSLLVVPQSVIKKWGIYLRFSENLRVYPEWFTHRAIHSLNRHGLSAAINMKLWELDKYQKRPPGADYANYSQYGNLSLVQEKLLNILNFFEFTTFSENLRPYLKADSLIDRARADL